MVITRNTALAATLCTISFSGTLNAADLDEGLVAYYPFNGDARDQSGNHNDGIVYGATLTVDRDGKQNSAYYFNGIDAYIKASADPLPTGERTVALWFKADLVSNMQNLIGYGGFSCGESWLMGINHWGEPAYSITSHCGVNTLLSYYTQEPVGEWFHYAITTNDAGTTIYINGSEVESNSAFINNTIVAGTDLAIGVAVSPAGYAPYVDGNIGYHMGSLDEIRIYNRALSEAEIVELYSHTEQCTLCDQNGDGKFSFRGDFRLWREEGCMSSIQDLKGWLTSCKSE